MKFRTKQFLIVFTLALGLAAMVLVGCTVTPHKVQSTEASYDGNEQNSGIVADPWNPEIAAHMPDGSIIVTPKFRDRYNALIADWGMNFKPALKPDDGMQRATNYWAIDGEHFIKFEQMNRWRKNGQH